MKIKYIQASKIIETTTSDESFNEIDSDLAFEILEMETALESAFKTHDKAVSKAQREVQEIRSKDEPKESDKKKLIKIAKDVDSIYQKEKEVDIDPFEYGTGSDRDLKPYLTLKTLRIFKPILKI